MKSAGRVERNAVLYLTDILQAAREIVDYAAVGRETFLADRMRQRAVIQCFEVMARRPRSCRMACGLCLGGTWQRSATS